VAGLGVVTAGQLRDMQMKQARGLGTLVLERLVAELQGVAASVVEVVEPQRRGMAMTRSFGTPVTDLETLMGAVAQYGMRAGEKLRSHGLVAGHLTVFFHTNTHKRDRPQHHGTRRVALHPMTDDSLELLAAGVRVNSVHPGIAETAIWDSLIGTDVNPSSNRPRGDTLKHFTAQAVPFGRAGRLDELACAVLWLASDKSSYVTETELVVDGGRSIAYLQPYSPDGDLDWPVTADVIRGSRIHDVGPHGAARGRFDAVRCTAFGHPPQDLRLCCLRDELTDRPCRGRS